MYFKNNVLLNHVKENMTIYIFMVTLFLTGIIFGAITVNSMDFIQKQDLFFHLDRYYVQINGDQEIASKDILKRSFFFHVKYLLLLFILGLTIIGLPVVWILVFIKGLVIGFSVGFIVNQLGGKGLLLASISIAPQNIITIPIYIIAGSLSMIFSLALLHKLFGNGRISNSLGKPFIQYTFVFLILLLCALGSSLIETFVANEAFKAILRTSYAIIFNLS
ncbi:stage II sporulation protein M [Pseudogracilibacillus sp. SO30301A]|uniref:stage II sporulation protein M n=1 Tax=Pseudogracilibacillus sp. SO30301A TaxID=3098291 RepID=UPI00300DE8A6